MFESPPSRRQRELQRAQPPLGVAQAQALGGRFCRRLPESLLAQQLKKDVEPQEAPAQRGVRSKAAFVTLGHQLLG